MGDEPNQRLSGCCSCGVEELLVVRAASIEGDPVSAPDCTGSPTTTGRGNPAQAPSLPMIRR